ncbi:MAG TPA: Hsp20/alpha crystallin family protein [Solirubrobacteraceae bacterium]|nr:Hsp20/alpha crystallin family protein [Solirubrobacteraceae bacterium]
MARPLTGLEPFAELGELRHRLDRAFGLAGPEADWQPPIDVVRENGNLVLRADVPGIAPEEVKVEVEENVLTVSGSHESSSEQRQEDFLRRERRYGAFSRSLALPAGVTAEEITASTRDGVVEVTIPLPKQDSRRRIEITPAAA